MVFLEFFYRLFSLDIGWIISFTMANLFWLFAFSAIANFMFSKVSLPLGFAAVTLYLWASIDTATAIGWVSLSAGFLSFSYIARIVGVTFASTFDSLKNRLTAVNLAIFFGTLFIWNVFMVGK